MPELLTAMIGIATLVALLTDRVRIDLLALIVMVATVALNLITPTQALSGFSRSAVLTLIGLFMLSRGLERTGVVARIADFIVTRSHGSESRLTFFLMGAAAGLSLLMNNVAAGAVILPAAMNASTRTGIAPSRLLIPVSFGTLLGGMATLFTTANIVASSVLKDQGLPSLSMLDFIPVGGLMLIAGMAYMMVIGRHLLPNRPFPTDTGVNTRNTVVRAFSQAELQEPPNIAIEERQRHSKGGMAVLITAVTLIASIALDSTLIPIIMIAGAIAMIITGCLDMDDGYRAIDWKTIFLVAGMTALSTAVVNTGLAMRLGNAVVSTLGAAGVLAVFAGLYLLTVAFAQILSGQVTALVVAPIAISAALSLKASPEAACVVVAVACSSCFLLPNAHPVNVLMMTPGNYRVSDFPRVGLGLTLVCFVTLLIGLRLFWGL